MKITYRLNEFAKLINRSVKTLQKWDRFGKLKAYRTATNRRYYTHDQDLEYMGLAQNDALSKKKVIVYYRVSSASQKDDMKSQKQALETFCAARGLAVDEWLYDIVRIPKLGWVKLTESLRFSGNILSATVSRIADKWFISICVQMETTPFKKSENQALVVGIDLGVKKLATLSNGETVEGVKPLKKLSRRLVQLQRHLARCSKGSKRYIRQKMKIARLHYHISCIRQDGLHKLTHRLCQSVRVICLEDLNVKGMLKNHKLAKAISDINTRE